MYTIFYVRLSEKEEKRIPFHFGETIENLLCRDRKIEERRGNLEKLGILIR